MRKTTMLLAAAMLAAAPMAYAQTEAPATVQEPAQAQSPTIEKVEVVALQELPEAEQTRVSEATAQTTDADLQGLRQSIDANAEASAALVAEGLTSQSVIAITMGSDGTLTLITSDS